MRFTSTGIFLLAVIATCGRGHATLIDFDVATDYNADFSEVVNGTDSLSWSSSNGVGGVAGRVNVLQGTLSDTTTLYNVSSYNLSTADPFTVSVFFLLPSSITGDAFITAAQVGFSEATNQGFLSGGGQDYISARVRASNTGTTFTLLGTLANAGTAANVNESGSFSLTTNNWYKLSATFTDIGTSFSYSASVQHYGVSGTTPGAIIQSISGTQVQTSLSNGTDTTAFAGFRANGNPVNKVLALDNFEITLVPEPGTFGALLMGLCGLLQTARSRRRG